MKFRQLEWEDENGFTSETTNLGYLSYSIISRFVSGSKLFITSFNYGSFEIGRTNSLSEAKELAQSHFDSLIKGYIE